MEDLEGHRLPPTRPKAVLLITGKLKKDPDKIGLLPYAILEHYDKLSLAFYDFRKDGKNPAIPMKCCLLPA